MDPPAPDLRGPGPDRTKQPPVELPAVAAPPTAPARSGLRGGLAALREKAHIQDRLVEKLLGQVIPMGDDGLEPDSSDADADAAAAAAAYDQRPGFTLATMSNNFRRFNARIGVVFQFQEQVVRILSWRQPSHTLSLLSAYTLVCLDPYLLSVVPIAALLLGAFIPGFLARHPAPPKGTLSSEQMGYSPRGPPLAPAVTVRPVKELSKDFFRNMRDLQNSMEDFSQGHDHVVALLVPLTNFADEALSSAVFLFLFVGAILMTLTARLLPWRFLSLLAGWAVIGAGHPTVARLLAANTSPITPRNPPPTDTAAPAPSSDPDASAAAGSSPTTAPEHVLQARAKTWLDNWIATDVILDSAPETREVEIFQLQRDAGTGEWEPWVFCPSPYDPLSQPRIAGERPRGTRFFEDVLPPDGWEWSEKKWALDLWSRDWVEERIITGVEVETEGERWVYDIYNEREARTGVVHHDGDYHHDHDHSHHAHHHHYHHGEDDGAARLRAPVMPHASWEEGDAAASERRGEWRRRRWVRLVKRKATAGPVVS